MAESETLKRVELPSGGWWEIETRPNWGEMMQIRRILVKMGAEGAEARAPAAPQTFCHAPRGSGREG